MATATSASMPFERRRITFSRSTVLATVPGFGLGWVLLNPDAGQPVAAIRLRPEQLIRGRLVDLNGQPAAGSSSGSAGSGNRPAPRESTMASTWVFPAAGRPRAWPRPVVTDGARAVYPARYRSRSHRGT